MSELSSYINYFFRTPRPFMFADRSIVMGSSHAVSAGAWAVKTATNSANDPLDHQFVVNMLSDDCRDGGSKETSMTFTLERDHNLTREDLDRIVRVWLQKLGIDNNIASTPLFYVIPVWDYISDVVCRGFDTLLKEIDSMGRRSLAMNVYIEIFGQEGMPLNLEPDVCSSEEESDMDVESELDESQYSSEEEYGMEEEGDHEPDYHGYDLVEEQMEEDEDGEEEVEKALRESAKNYLSDEAGVNFLKSGYSIKFEKRCCPICLEDVIECDDQVEAALLPCNHIFHGDCLISWIVKGHLTCPMCRFEL